MKSRTSLLGKCFSMLLVVSMLISTPLSALATTMANVGGEEVHSTFTEEVSEDKTHVNVEMELTTKEGIELQEVILPDGTTLYPEARDYIEGFRISQEGVEKNLVKYKAFKNETLTYKVKYITSNKEEKTVSFSHKVSKLSEAEDSSRASRAAYTVTFELNGGRALGSSGYYYQLSQTVIAGDLVADPIDHYHLEKAGYSFAGFYKDADCTEIWDFFVDTMPEHDITIYVKWIINRVYTVEYEPNNGTTIEPKTNLTFYDSGLLPDVEVTKEGYTLRGWYSKRLLDFYTIDYISDRDKVTDETPYSSLFLEHLDDYYNEVYYTSKLVAVWDRKGYTVKYDTDGGTTINDKTDAIWEGTLLPDTEPIKLGYTFTGWTYNGITVTDATIYKDLAENDKVAELTLVAQWEPKTYTVNYETGTDINIAAKTDVEWEDAGLLPTDTLTKPGYTFVGWVYEDATNGNKEVNENTKYGEVAPNDVDTEITLVAQWVQKVYTVKYDTDGGTAINDKTNVTWEGTVLPDTEPTKPGYTFTGWTHNGTTVMDATLYKDLATTDAAGTSITLVASWTELSDYEITFQLNGGNVISKSTVVVSNLKYNDVIPVPNVEKDGHTFLEWTYKGNAVPEGASIKDIELDNNTKKLVLEAEWKLNTYTVEFAYVEERPEGVAVPNSVEVEHGKQVSEPVVQEVEGWKQDGWYVDETCQTAYDFNTAVTYNVKLYMKWTKEETMNPEEPTKPQEPTQPENIGDVESGQGSNSTVTTPSTGDSTNVNVLFMTFIVSGFGLILYKRREAKQ